MESDILRKLSNEDKIIATGGGIVQSAENRRFKKPADCSLLRGRSDCLVDRIQQDETSIRPLALENKRRNKKHYWHNDFLGMKKCDTSNQHDQSNTRKDHRYHYRKDQKHMNVSYLGPEKFIHLSERLCQLFPTEQLLHPCLFARFVSQTSRSGCRSCREFIGRTFITIDLLSKHPEVEVKSEIVLLSSSSF